MLSQIKVRHNVRSSRKRGNVYEKAKNKNKKTKIAWFAFS